MTTTALPSPVRSSALPCRPSGTLAVMLFAAACALAACDPRPLDAPIAEPVRMRSAAPTPLLGRAVAEPWYVGDEYAEEQRKLAQRGEEPLSPTF